MFNNPGGHPSDPSLWSHGVHGTPDPMMNQMMAAAAQMQQQQQQQQQNRAHELFLHQQNQMRHPRDLNGIIGSPQELPISRPVVGAHNSAALNQHHLYMHGMNSGSRQMVLNQRARQAPVAGRPNDVMANLMLPPAMDRASQLQQKKERAALQRKREQELKEQEERKANAIFSNPSLFGEPEKLQSNESSRQVSNILGDHRNALIGHSLVGVDYQPPTPAPAAAHIIGEEDDDVGASKDHQMKPPSMPGIHSRSGANNFRIPSTSSNPMSDNFRRPPSVPSFDHSRKFQNANRPLSDMSADKQRYSLSEDQLRGRLNGTDSLKSSATNSQLPGPAFKGPNERKRSPSLDCKNADSSRLKKSASALPKLSLDQPKIQNVHDILREMQNPLGPGFGGDFGAMPPPLTAIETPRIADHEGNNAKSKPRYFGDFAPPNTLKDIGIANLSEDSGDEAPSSKPQSGMIELGRNESKPVKSESVSKPPEKNKTEGPLPPTPTKNNSSSDSSDNDSDSSNSDSSSDEEGGKREKRKSNKTAIVPNNVPKVPPPAPEKPDKFLSEIPSVASNDDEFTLTNLIDKFRTPGSQTSPKVVSGTKKSSPHPLSMQDDVEGDPIDSMLSNTPQPLPDLIDHASNVVSDHRLMRASILEDADSLDGGRSKKHLNRVKDSLSSDGEDYVEPPEKPSRRSKNHSKSKFRNRNLSDDTKKESPSANINRPMPRQSALAFTKKERANNAAEYSDDEMEDAAISAHVSPTSNRKRRKNRARETPKTAPEYGSKRIPNKQTPSYVEDHEDISLSSSSNNDDETDHDWQEGRAKKSRKSSQGAGGKGRGAKAERKASDNLRGARAKGATASQESPMKDMAITSTKKAAAMSKIFFAQSMGAMATKPGKGGGIKVEVVDQPSSAKTTPKSQHSPSEETVKEDVATPYFPDNDILKRPVVRRSTDDRPVLFCRLPLISLPLELSQKLTKCSDIRQMSKDQSPSSVNGIKRSRRKKRRLGDENAEDDDEDESESCSSSNSRKRRKRIKRDSRSGTLMPPPERSMDHTRRMDDDDFNDEEVQALLDRAQELKAEASRDPNLDRKALTSIKAVTAFIMFGTANEHRGEKIKAFNAFKDALDLVKNTCRPFSHNGDNFDNKLAVLSLRCQSLLNLKMYKLRSRELNECQKIIGDHIQKSCSSNSPSGAGGNGSAISPTPSPAGSEGSVCSKSSGYTSSGEIGNMPHGDSGASRHHGVTTPVNCNSGTAVSVPRNVMQKQHQLCTYLSNCHELWEMADAYANRGHCRDFLSDIYGNSLTLHSSLKDLVKHTQKGVEILLKEKGDFHTH